MKITKESIAKAEQVLIDNGIEADEAKTVLEAVGYTLMDVSLYDTAGNTLEKDFHAIVRWADEDVYDSMDPDCDDVTPAIVEYWWNHHSSRFAETLVETGNEILACIDWEAVKREMEESNA